MSTNWLALLLAVLLVSMALCQNDTTTTEAPSVETTQYFTISPTTLRPTANPSVAPTKSPTIAIEDGQSALYKVTTKLSGALDCDFVEKNKGPFIIIFCSACDLPYCGLHGEGARVDITECTAIASDQRRRLLQDTSALLDVTFSVAIKDANDLNTFEQTLETSFQDSFQTEVSVEYSFITVTEVSSVNEGTGDGDEFLGDTEPSFGERLEGSYAVVGIICIVIGTTWLLLMWRETPFEYPSYKDAADAGASGGRPNAVEMVPAASAGDNQ